MQEETRVSVARKMFSIRLPLGLVGRLRAAADKEQRTVSNLIVYILTDWIERWERKQKPNV